ncbi:MAG: DUF1841 family protein [Legionellaceae bacterium]|nr:DUF1841 family protein [Legionellaceae bacterium]
MFFGNSIAQTRQYFFDAWHKFQHKLPLSPLESQLLAVIHDHPEYHQFLENRTQSLPDFSPEQGQSNPFLHMGLHLALREQIHTNRPSGIATVYRKLSQKYAPLDAEHLMMNCLADTLWLAQRHQHAPDEQSYLENLRKLL